MKHIYRISRIPQILSVIVFISFLFPNTSLAFQVESELMEVELSVSCVEQLSNGNLMAWFGYNNPNPEPETITVQRKESYIAYNYTREIKYVNEVFLPGVHEKVFSQEFNSDDWVRWTVKFSNDDTKIVQADASSVRCDGELLQIIPDYQPPEGGKEYNTLIGAELTSLI